MIAQLLLLISLVILLPSVSLGQGSRDRTKLRFTVGETRWYRLNAADADFTRFRNAILADARALLLDNNLSEVTSDDGLQVIMKVPNASSLFRVTEASGVSSLILQIYDRFDHKELLDLLSRDVNWSNIRDEL